MQTQLRAKVIETGDKLRSYIDKIKAGMRMQEAKAHFKKAAPVAQEVISEAHKEKGRVTPGEMAKVLQAQARKENEVVDKFVEFLKSNKENNRFTEKSLTDDAWKDLQTQFTDWVKANRGQVNVGSAVPFFKAHSTKIIDELKKTDWGTAS